MRITFFDMPPMLDPDLWDEPAELVDLDCLDALGDDGPEPSRREDEGGGDDR